MPQAETNELPLADRVNDYLRSETPTVKAFEGKESAAAAREVEMDEYLLERAEAELRAALEEVETIRQRLDARKAFKDASLIT